MHTHETKFFNKKFLKQKIQNVINYLHNAVFLQTSLTH